MPTQKTFKSRVRTRMTKTGESYTTARHQLLRKSADHAEAAEAMAAAADDPSQYLTSDDAMERATGEVHATWFARLDAWGATERTHTEIARWLHETGGVPGWWSQNITVAYERTRGMRAPHELTSGFSFGVSRTMGVDATLAMAAFTDAAIRRRWLTGATIRQRPTRAANTARFDWADPPSILIVYLTPKAPGKTTVSVTLERLPDAEAVAQLKLAWKAWLSRLKALLES